MNPAERRVHYRQNLSLLYLPVYDQLCESLPPEWGPFYGLRTFEEQTQLYAQGRTLPGIIVTDARAGESPHNYGCASDWIVWDENNRPIWIDAHDPRWQIYLSAILKAGGRPGFMFHHSDPPHNELAIDCSWKHVLLAFKTNNMTAAQEKIRESLIK